MTKFNPENKKDLTIGETLGPAMKITEQADADQYLQAYIAHIQSFMDKDKTPRVQTAEQVAKINLGYFAGYYDAETRKRVERLFTTEHPVFGKAELGTPTPEQMLSAGIKLGKASKLKDK